MVSIRSGSHPPNPDISPTHHVDSADSLGNSASFSCCALMKASLKRLASVMVGRQVSHHFLGGRRKGSAFPIMKKDRGRRHNVLSLLANRMASVCGSGSPSLTSAAAFHTQLRSLPTLGDSLMSGTTAQRKKKDRQQPSPYRQFITQGEEKKRP